jgi:hypothetical protein
VPDPIDRNISFRAQIRGALDDFLRDEGFECSATAASIVAVASRLAVLREEGNPLWPEVYFCTSVDNIAAVLQGSEVLKLGTGPLADATVLRALKECAPLATGGWVIFVQREPEQFTYGLFTPNNLPLAITPYEALVESSVEGTTVVVVRRLAENCVEIKGGRGNRRCLFFSDRREETPSPMREIERFCDAITLNVAAEQREDVRRYFYRTLSELLIKGHGSLLVVQSSRRRTIPTNLADSIRFPAPISIADRVRDYREHKDDEALAKLDRATALVRGVLESDGIVIFKNDGSIIAYRAFLTTLHQSASTVAAGGARRRTFEALPQARRLRLGGCANVLAGWEYGVRWTT